MNKIILSTGIHVVTFTIARVVAKCKLCIAGKNIYQLETELLNDHSPNLLCQLCLNCITSCFVILKSNTSDNAEFHSRLVFKPLSSVNNTTQGLLTMLQFLNAKSIEISDVDRKTLQPSQINEIPVSNIVQNFPKDYVLGCMNVFREVKSLSLQKKLALINNNETLDYWMGAIDYWMSRVLTIRSTDNTIKIRQIYNSFANNSAQALDFFEQMKCLYLNEVGNIKREALVTTSDSIMTIDQNNNNNNASSNNITISEINAPIQLNLIRTDSIGISASNNNLNNFDFNNNNDNNSNNNPLERNITFTRQQSLFWAVQNASVSRGISSYGNFASPSNNFSYIPPESTTQNYFGINSPSNTGLNRGVSTLNRLTSSSFLNRGVSNFNFSRYSSNFLNDTLNPDLLLNNHHNTNIHNETNVMLLDSQPQISTPRPQSSRNVSLTVPSPPKVPSIEANNNINYNHNNDNNNMMIDQTNTERMKKPKSNYGRKDPSLRNASIAESRCATIGAALAATNGIKASKNVLMLQLDFGDGDVFEVCGRLPMVPTSAV